MKILDRFGISNTVQSTVTSAESCLIGVFKSIGETAEYNQYKVIDAFRTNRISARHFSPTTGYGYSDEGRQALCEVFAGITKAQKAILSPHIVSGTHAISLALYAVLRPLDTLISVSGKPYDTLRHVIGGKGKLHRFFKGGGEAHHHILTKDGLESPKEGVALVIIGKVDDIVEGGEEGLKVGGNRGGLLEGAEGLAVHAVGVVGFEAAGELVTEVVIGE